METLFGTDGIRGEVGKYPLTQEAVFVIGKTIGAWLKEVYPQAKELKIVLGKDTRESGDELEKALLAGARQQQITALRLGTCPTPAVAYLTRAWEAQLGVAISASHNPGSDNGIKFFDAGGYKLLPSAEDRIAAIFHDHYSRWQTGDPDQGDLAEESEYFPIYLELAKKSLEGEDLKGLKVVIDCAFGSYSDIAPRAFADLGAEVVAMHNAPDGKNINVNCGTLYPALLSRTILEQKADLGVAFDGDGDRVMLGDEKGDILDGDQIMAILGKYLMEKKRLRGNLIVSTQMSNIGFELFLEQLGVRLIRTKVGDKYVLEEMLKQKAILGGEQSGHIILLERSTTGDGLIAALESIKVMLKKRQPLSELNRNFRKYPQVLVNVRVKKEKPFADIPDFNEELERQKKKLGKKGRIFVRYSGTEKLARIMIEGEEQTRVEEMAQALADIVRKHIGV